MTIKQMFPKMLLVLGLVSLLLVLMLARVAYATVTATDNYDKNGRKISTTQKSSEGWEITTTYDPETGGIKSSSTKDTSGSTETINYAPKPPCVPSFGGVSTCGVSSVTNAGSDGTSETRNYNPPCLKGPCKPTSTSTYDPKGGLGYGSTVTCDGQGKCTKRVEAMDPSTRKRLQAEFQPKVQPPATTTPKDKPPLVPGGKDQLKADVLKQIEDKPLGGLGVGKEKLKTGGIVDQFKNRAAAVELNPQPLPPGPPPPPDKLGGNVQFDKKFQTGVTQQIKDKLKVQESTVGQKSKSGVKTGSQSASQIHKIDAASKLKFQTQAVQQNRINSKFKNWGSSAGPSGAVKHYPHDKLR
jgi:hypothetical protein